MHVEYATSNANCMLGYLLRNFCTAPSSLKLKLYITLVRSKLEYACAIWDPTHTILIQTLEAMQTRAASFILSNYSRHSSVTSIKSTVILHDFRCSENHLAITKSSRFHKIYHYNSYLRAPCLIHFIIYRQGRIIAVRFAYQLVAQNCAITLLFLRQATPGTFPPNRCQHNLDEEAFKMPRNLFFFFLLHLSLCFLHTYCSAFEPCKNF